MPLDFDSVLSEAIAAAWAVRERAYAPYSRFAVGAALVGGGRVFVGCNVENVSFGLTQCAERAAVCAAVSAGVREFEGIVVVADTREPISPCGACRQVLSEFHPALRFVSVGREGVRWDTTLDILLPRASTGILDG